MSDPNDRQVGGSHYRNTNIQHWDVMAKLGADYFVGEITGYLARYKFKNGLQDLEKALHYLEKLIEVTNQREDENSDLVITWCKELREAGVPNRAIAAIGDLLEGHLNEAHRHLVALITSVERANANED